jgi:hypothetical protein
MCEIQIALYRFEQITLTLVSNLKLKAYPQHYCLQYIQILVVSKNLSYARPIADTIGLIWTHLIPCRMRRMTETTSHFRHT